MKRRGDFGGYGSSEELFAEEFLSFLEHKPCPPDATPEQELAWARARGYVEERDGRYILTKAGQAYIAGPVSAP